MNIRQATPEEFAQVRAFYFAVIDGMAQAEYGPGWKKDIYPAPEYLRNSIRDGELYIGVDEAGEIIAAMVLNHRCNAAYLTYDWPTQATWDKVLVLHTLAVLPQHTGRGLAKQMVRFAISEAQVQGAKAIRLDVLAGNVPAEHLYPALGFAYLATIPMFYEDTGWTDYKLYELAL